MGASLNPAANTTGGAQTVVSVPVRQASEDEKNLIDEKIGSKNEIISDTILERAINAFDNNKDTFFIENYLIWPLANLFTDEDSDDSKKGNSVKRDSKKKDSKEMNLYKKFLKDNKVNETLIEIIPDKETTLWSFLLFTLSFHNTKYEPSWKNIILDSTDADHAFELLCNEACDIFKNYNKSTGYYILLNIYKVTKNPSSLDVFTKLMISSKTSKNWNTVNFLELFNKFLSLLATKDEKSIQEIETLAWESVVVLFSRIYIKYKPHDQITFLSGVQKIIESTYSRESNIGNILKDDIRKILISSVHNQERFRIKERCGKCLRRRQYRNLL